MEEKTAKFSKYRLTQCLNHWYVFIWFREMYHAWYQQAVITGWEIAEGRNLSHWPIEYAYYHQPIKMLIHQYHSSRKVGIWELTNWLQRQVTLRTSKHIANQRRDCAPPDHITSCKIWPIDLSLTSSGKIFQLCSLICHMTTTGVASCAKSSSGRPPRTKLLVFFVHRIWQLAMMVYMQCAMLFNLGSCFSKCWASLQWWPVYF